MINSNNVISKKLKSYMDEKPAKESATAMPATLTPLCAIQPYAKTDRGRMGQHGLVAISRVCSSISNRENYESIAHGLTSARLFSPSSLCKLRSALSE